MDHAAINEAMQLLTGPEAGAVLHAALLPTGATLQELQVRNVHRRGRSSVSVVYDVTATTDAGTTNMQVVAHCSTRTVPVGATVLEVEGLTIHVWRVPNDPYLPGLPSAVAPQRVREFLDRVGGPTGDVELRTRAYRPTRRAVIEVALSEQRHRLLYLKVLGGSSAQRVEQRSSELAEIHRRLAPGLPVPHVVGLSAGQGILAITALPGRTLRSRMVRKLSLPDPEILTDLSRKLFRIDVPDTNDPQRYANIDRHVRHLGRLLPDQREVLGRVQAAVSDLGGPLGTVHGDLHDGQLLFDDGARLTGVLDVDGVGRGHLASDAGRLIAYIEAGGLAGDIGSRADDYAREVMTAYEDLVAREQIVRGAAAAWIGLSTGPYRSQKANWQDLTRQRLDRASRWVDELG